MEFKTIKDAALDLRKAMESNDAAKIEAAWEGLGKASAADALAKVQQDMALYQETKDEKILAARGVRKLTSKEEAWYNKLIEVMKSGNPKQAFIEIIGTDDEDDIMPSSIIEDVFRNLTQEHPLLSRISVQSVGYLTKWILNAHTAQTAAWGAITVAIEQEITSDLKVVDIKQNKLSCFAILELGMADLGPAFLDSYIRTVLTEAMALALEVAIVSGTGLSMPIGMDRDLSDGSTATGYSQKATTAVADFTPASYGELLAKFAKDEDGKQRKFGQVALICNQEDYLTKIMPATTVLNSAGAYVNNLFPFPTEVIVSNAVTTGQAILGLIDEYVLFIGKAARNNVIQYSDDYRFIEDQRVFKVVQYADGRAYDNTSFLLLDISTIDPAYITVKSADAVETA
ncbi:MAG: phage major capsid protein [Lachnospiraceae bacterium]|nr:phage major capsid protein [Lachnospiraceae bacterium]